MKPCLKCGEPSAGSYCEEHQPSNSRDRRAAGYDWAFDKLSKRARRLQPWCSDCFTTEDLTCDHSETAWKRKAEGKPIRLSDVDVVCRGCNTRRGRQRPADTQGRSPSASPSDARAKAQSPSLLTSRDRGAA